MQSAEVTPLTNSIDNTCRRLDVGRTTVYGLIAEGHLHPIKIGRRTLITETELQRLLAERIAAAKRDA